MGDSFKQNVNNDDPYTAVSFFKEVDNAKEDIIKMEKLYASLQESNETFKTVSSAQKTMELWTRTNADLDSVLKLGKQINKKHDALVRMNAAKRGSSDDQKRASVISEFAETIQEMMRSFQGMRMQMETDHRQVIESRYFAIVGEKATEEAIDTLVTTPDPEILLHRAIQEFGRVVVLETVAEIQERRHAMKEIRKSLMNLHQMFLGMSMPIEPQAGGTGAGGGGLPSPVDPPKPTPPVPAQTLGGGAIKLGRAGRLNDYERETRRQAYFALVIATLCIVLIVISYLVLEVLEEKRNRKAFTEVVPEHKSNL